MTSPRCPAPVAAGSASMPGAVTPHRAWPLLLAAVLVVGCAGKPPVRPPPAPSVPMLTPVPPKPAPVPVAPPPSAAPSVAIESPGVAARFPVPAAAQAYRTPGLMAGRTSYTTDVEMQAQLRALARDGGPGQPVIRVLAAGRSQRGLPIEALWFTRQATVDAAGAAPPEGRPLVLFVGQQHGDEPAPAEALLVLAGQLANGPLQPLLKQVDVIVVPRVNPDGAAREQRFGDNGIDINRDHLLLRTPEAQGLARLVRDYRPAVIVDAHEYSAVGEWPAWYGISRRHDVLLQYGMAPNMAEFVTRASEEWFRRPLLAAMERERLSTEWYHTGHGDQRDRPVVMGGVRPDTLRNVGGLRHAVSFLIETRGKGLGRQHLLRRVHGQVVAATSILQSTAQRGADLQKLRRYVDSEVSARACRGDAVIEAEPTPSEYTLAGLDPASGADRSISVNWMSALQLRSRTTRPRACGYWLAGDQIATVQRLRQLGLTVQQLPDRMSLRGEAYQVREQALREQAAPREGPELGMAPPVPVDLQPTLLDAEGGSYYVPLTQPLAHLAIAALEPDTPGSYLAHRIIDRAASVARVTALPSAKLDMVP